MIKFALKVVLMAGVFYGCRLHLLDGVDVVPNPDGPARGVRHLAVDRADLRAGQRDRRARSCGCSALPFVLLTLGLFLLVINAALLGITAALTDRLTVDGFGSALLGGALLAIGGWLADQLLDRD